MENNVNTVKLNEPVIKAKKNKSGKLWSKLKKNKTAMVGLGILIVYAIILLLGPWWPPMIHMR